MASAHRGRIGLAIAFLGIVVALPIVGTLAPEDGRQAPRDEWPELLPMRNAYDQRAVDSCRAAEAVGAGVEGEDAATHGVLTSASLHSLPPLGGVFP